MDEPVYLNLSSLSKRLGLSPRTLRSRISDPVRPLPAYRIGGKLLFRLREVEAWVEQCAVRPVDVDALVQDILGHRRKVRVDHGS